MVNNVESAEMSKVGVRSSGVCCKWENSREGEEETEETGRWKMGIK